jgi:hypothetical protein
VPRIIGFAGTVVSVYNIMMTNLISISKGVSRECRGFLFGIALAFGSFGAYVSLTLG